jgi:formylglycine-generating enzyme required for sulfatase activity
MHGNVWESCEDWYDNAYYSVSPTNDPQGPASGSFRVVRGGTWSRDAYHCRSANRDYYGPSDPGNVVGFRVVLAP